MNYKILFIDNDSKILQMNKCYFENAGYSVFIAKNTNEAMPYIQNNTLSCIILEVMLPEVDGFTFCKQLRTFCNIPILFLSGRVTEDDKIHGLLYGADDYVTKPYSLRELDARIKVNIRRTQLSRVLDNQTSIWKFSSLCIHLLSHKVTWKKQEIPLSNREFDLLFFLAKNAGKICTFEAIGNSIWGSYLPTDRRSIMVNVSRLRKKLEHYIGNSTLIENVRSKGYRFKHN